MELKPNKDLSLNREKKMKSSHKGEGGHKGEKGGRRKRRAVFVPRVMGVFILVIIITAFTASMQAAKQVRFSRNRRLS